MEDASQTNQTKTASMNRSKAPQKVEVVVANPSSVSEVNILCVLSIFILRIGFCILMIHHGLENYKILKVCRVCCRKIFSIFACNPVIWTFEQLSLN